MPEPGSFRLLQTPIENTCEKSDGNGQTRSPPNPIGLSEVKSRGFIHTDSKEALTFRKSLQFNGLRSGPNIRSVIELGPRRPIKRFASGFRGISRPVRNGSNNPYLCK
jgi:hypothetical protein